MTKEEFVVLQLDLQQSGKSIKSYLQEAGIVYSTYNYWRKKLEAEAKPARGVKNGRYLKNSPNGGCVAALANIAVLVTIWS